LHQSNGGALLTISFEQALIQVWRQALVENADVVVLGTDRYPVRLTPKRRLRQVDFTFDGNQIRGLEQNPKTKRILHSKNSLTTGPAWNT
jgi:hypothetical protein